MKYFAVLVLVDQLLGDRYYKKVRLYGWVYGVMNHCAAGNTPAAQTKQADPLSPMRT